MALLGYLPPTQSFQVSLEDCEVNYERNWILTSQTSHLIIFLPLLLILFFLFVALIIFAVLRGRLFRIIPVGGKTLVENTDLGQRGPKKGKVPHKLWQLFPLHRLDRFHAKGRECESRPGHRKQNENLSFNRVSPLSGPKPSGYDTNGSKNQDQNATPTPQHTKQNSVPSVSQKQPDNVTFQVLKVVPSAGVDWKDKQPRQVLLHLDGPLPGAETACRWP